jgi:hypothetical protein
MCVFLMCALNNQSRRWSRLESRDDEHCDFVILELCTSNVGSGVFEGGLHSARGT